MANAERTQRQHAVVIHLKLSDEEFGSFDERENAFTLEDRLEDAVTDSAIGEYDGHEFGDGWCRFYIYGDDANVMADAVLPLVRNLSPRTGSFVVKRFGPPGAPQEEMPL
jgi:hypothetical protein